MGMNTSFCKILISFFVILVTSNVAHSAFIDNGLTTIDTSTSLEWLDLTETQGYSYNEVEALLLPGGVFDEYRRATETEISNMFSSFGLVSGPLNSTHNDFINLFGATTYQGNYPESFGYADSSGHSMALVYGLDFYTPGENYLVYTGGLLHNKSINFAGFGSYLVKAVPIPAGVWLFISGILGLIGFTKRRTANITS
jgi:hypothetical protein